MKLSAIVVWYHPNEENYRNILKYIDEVDKVYVVDNTPNKDNSSLIDSKKYKKIEYIGLNDNLGIAKALNVGFEHVIKDKYDWALTMDQDSIFKSGDVTKLKDFIQEIKNNKKTAKIYDLNYEKLGIVSPFHLTERSKNEKPEGISKPLVIMTSGNIVSVEAYKKVKGFKDWLFIDAVDFDFGLNLRQHGYEIVQVNSVKLNHPLGDTKEKHILGKTVYTSNHSAMRRYYITRNRYYIYDMYHNEKDFEIFCNLERRNTKREFIKILLFEKDKINKCKSMIKGYRDYKKGIRGKGDLK